MVLPAIIKRRAVREFKSDPVSDKDIEEIIKAAQFAPTAYNNRSTQFIIVKDSETKTKIFEIVGQEFLRFAPVIIIPVVDLKKTGLPIQDLSVATENIFLQAAELGLGTVWKNVDNGEQTEKIRELLNIPKQFEMINLIPLGYPKSPSSPHTDEMYDQNKIHQEKW